MHTVKIVNKEESHHSARKSSKEWHRWCRICAKTNIQTINIYAKDKNTKNSKSVEQDHKRLQTALSKYFSVDIKRNDQYPNHMCKECFSLLNSLIDFNIHVDKVQKMYAALKRTRKGISLDIPSWRLKYGVLEDVFMYLSLREKDSYATVDPSPDSGRENKARTKHSHDEVLNMETSFENILVNDLENNRNNENLIKIRDSNNGEVEITTGSDSYARVVPSPESGSESKAKTKHSHDDVLNKESSFENILVNDLENRNNENLTKIRDSNNSEVEITTGSEEKRKLNSSETKPIEYKYDCSKCTLRFRRFGSFRLHMNKKHGILPKLPNFTCSKCFRSFKNTVVLKRHMKIHRPSSEKELFPCPLCEGKFQSNYYVTTHIKLVHEGLREFICEECGKAMRSQAGLNDHMLTHTDFAPFKCETCKRGFKSQKRLKNHADIHSSDNHTCEKCGLQLSSRTTLRRHKLVHSDVMKHKCDYCGRAFKRAISLKDHLLLHSGLKPYSCKFCDKTFSNSSNCRIHMKRIHPNDFVELKASGVNYNSANVPKLAILKSV